ncbi:polysaccharide deacetylase family protein [Cryomorphaceae bacterium 1068]|nr:polysaccharide deacetylase family protein [Cryomorphaceae bacterium 1068]
MINILTNFQSPRLTYVSDTIFKKWLKLDYRFVSSADNVSQDSCLITYGNHSVEGSINIYCEGLLSESVLRDELPQVFVSEEIPLIFEASNAKGFELSYDLFSAVFFCLSRYEEYVNTNRDEHGRFKAEDSIFHEYNRIPYVDKWVHSLQNLLEKKLPGYKNPRSLRWLSTMDMDIAFAFKGRSLTRKIGATGKDILGLKVDRLQERISVLSDQSADPYDTYELFLRDDGADTKRLFVPVGDRSRFDNNLSVTNSFIKQHISALGKKVSIGLHPSYQSLGNTEVIRKEKERLELTSGLNITYSRQHFLRFTLPDTYIQLESLGMEKDFSMGFHDEIGFRSGTAFDHCFYDLLNDTPLTIEIVPLIAMDSAMKNYMKLSTKEALKAIEQLLTGMKKTGGIFTTVWHNHSLSDTEDWKGWRSVYLSTSNMVRSHR